MKYKLPELILECANAHDGDLKTSRKHFEIIDWLQSSFESYTAAALRGLDAYSNSSYMN